MGFSFSRDRLIAIFAAVIGIATAIARGEVPCRYEVSAVIQGPWCGSFFEYPPTFATNIGKDGRVVGHYWSCDVGPSEAFLWTSNQGFLTLPRPSGYSEAIAEDIDNQTGWIVGFMEPQGTNLFTAALWIDAVPTDLGTLPGGNFSRARAVSQGLVVGEWGNNATGDPALQAFIWRGGFMRDLGPDLGTPNGVARDVNSRGQVVGWMGQASWIDARAFIWHHGAVTELKAIPGGFTSEAFAINEAGHVVGAGRLHRANASAVVTHAFSWINGQMVDLGTLPGFDRSGAFDVNDADIIVGYAWSPGNRAVIWHEGSMVDLNDLIPPDAGVHLDIAYAVNEQGQIACEGTDQSGDIVGLVLTPVAVSPGDLTCDGHVLADDFQALLEAWGPCPPEGNCLADLDGDGIVGIIDLLALLGNWG
jgi:probable HAF family extracellular repeat protein